MWGLAFKPNTDDMREAPSLVIINKLLELGAKIRAYDPAAMENAKFYLGDKIEYANDEYDALENADALLVVTEWNDFRKYSIFNIKLSLHGSAPIVEAGKLHPLDIHGVQRTNLESALLDEGWNLQI